MLQVHAPQKSVGNSVGCGRTLHFSPETTRISFWNQIFQKTSSLDQKYWTLFSFSMSALDQLKKPQTNFHDLKGCVCFQNFGGANLQSSFNTAFNLFLGFKRIIQKETNEIGDESTMFLSEALKTNTAILDLDLSSSFFFWILNQIN